MRQARAERIEAARLRLRAKGKRLTSQRDLLLQIVERSGQHLTAEEIYQKAHRRDPRLNLATVYRTLSMLREIDLVTPRYLPDHRSEQFEVKPQVEHYHLTCTDCGRTIEFESPLVPRLREALARELGVEVSRTCVCLEGLCAHCKKKMS